MFNNIKSVDNLAVARLLKPYMFYVVFAVAVIFGFLTYGFNMANGYVNGDGLAYGFYYNAGSWDIGQGRWALAFFSGRFITSWFEGIMSILSLAVAAAFAVKFFEVESFSTAVIMGMLIATQTHFAQWQGSPYILFPYSVGFAAAVIGAYTMWNGIRYKCWVTMGFSAILLAFSIGIYQAYIAIAVCMCYIKLTLGITRGGVFGGVETHNIDSRGVYISGNNLFNLF